MREQHKGSQRCLCVDGDMCLLQEGIRSVLRRELPEARVVKPEETSGAAPDLLILCASDHSHILPKLRGYRDSYPGIKIILLYEGLLAGDLLSFLALGCRCVHRATLSAQELMECIRMVEKNVCLWDQESMGLVLGEAEKYHGFLSCMQQEIKTCVPTQRELEIAKGILAGLNNEGLAKRLYLSTGTVKNIIAGILDKYDFKNRAQIISLLALE